MRRVFLLPLLLSACRVDPDSDGLRSSVSISFSSSPVASAAPPASASPRADAAEEADLKRHHASIARCTAEGRIAVIGYGWEIVCLDPKFVAWHEGPPDRHDPSGL